MRRQTGSTVWYVVTVISLLEAKQQIEGEVVAVERATLILKLEVADVRLLHKTGQGVALDPHLVGEENIWNATDGFAKLLISFFVSRLVEQPVFFDAKTTIKNK